MTRTLRRINTWWTQHALGVLVFAVATLAAVAVLAYLGQNQRITELETESAGLGKALDIQRNSSALNGAPVVVPDSKAIAKNPEVIIQSGLRSPKGEDGSDGKNGKDGKDGLPGTPGATLSPIPGTAGVDGADGKDGTDGVDGKDGIQGPAGPPPSAMYFTAGGVKYTCTPDSPGGTTYHCTASDGSATPSPTPTPTSPESTGPTVVPSPTGETPAAKNSKPANTPPDLPLQSPFSHLFAVDRRLYSR